MDLIVKVVINIYICECFFKRLLTDLEYTVVKYDNLWLLSNLQYITDLWCQVI